MPYISPTLSPVRQPMNSPITVVSNNQEVDNAIYPSSIDINMDQLSCQQNQLNQEQGVFERSIDDESKASHADIIYLLLFRCPIIGVS